MCNAAEGEPWTDRDVLSVIHPCLSLLSLLCEGEDCSASISTIGSAKLGSTYGIYVQHLLNRAELYLVCPKMPVQSGDMMRFALACIVSLCQLVYGSCNTVIALFIPNTSTAPRYLWNP